jgi:hypothetical protein
MYEQHLDLLPFPPRRLGRPRKLNAGLAGGHLRAATRLKLASAAVIFAGAIEHCCPIVHRVPVEVSTLPAGQT